MRDTRLETVVGAGVVPVKVCGVTLERDARAVVEMGAGILGFNFWKKSKRYFGEVEANGWLKEMAGKVYRVGVFVDAPLEEVRSLYANGWIDAAQLHGDESPEYCRQLVKTQTPFWKAIGVRDETSLAALADFPTHTVVLDAYAPVERGGTGRRFDWNLARRAVVENPDWEVVLSGGLIPENVEEAVRAVSPAAVDVASGVEVSPGVKDLEKVKAFIEGARRGTA